MGTKEIKFCDITGEEGDVEKVEFEFKGNRYSIELCLSEVIAMEGAFKPYIAAGEEITPGQVEIPVQASKPSGPDPVTVREWAISNSILVDGKAINEKGRVPKAFTDLFLAEIEAREASNAE
ncbi:histone-like nucleoid-structuring protein Lsr2 [Streptomyces sp. NBC_01500]|uniref:Lsr2 dimerization domain-containing protein n=1 Tax=Streptomyces sp. NBC_01500 TaxID=2903886 RepID=UPI00225A2345|nr:histone-like nucleoid-structuring protein Lsr2 [Streptomyces sp. NBC_01500]MCX4554148.1 Lsr2 family protein [Streptomyces sp. NBC_01500]